MYNDLAVPVDVMLNQRLLGFPAFIAAVFDFILDDRIYLG